MEYVHTKTRVKDIDQLKQIVARCWMLPPAGLIREVLPETMTMAAIVDS